MRFPLRPRRWSFRPAMLASVSTRVVSWNEAADIKLSVDRERTDAEQKWRTSSGSPPRIKASVARVRLTRAASDRRYFMGCGFVASARQPRIV